MKTRPVKPKVTKTINRPSVFKVLLFDCLIALSVFFTMLWQNELLAKSVLLGFLIFILPHTFFAWRAFKVMGAAKIREVANAMFAAEIGKFIFTISLFAYSFTMVATLNVLALFLAYVAIFIVHQGASFYWLGRKLV